MYCCSYQTYLALNDDPAGVLRGVPLGKLIGQQKRAPEKLECRILTITQVPPVLLLFIELFLVKFS